MGACADADATAAGWQCATFKAPKDYGNPGAGFVKIAVTRLPAQDQAHRTGRCSSTTAAPAARAVDTTQAIGTDLFGPVNDHFDLVAFDPRGVGQSSPVDRLQAVNQETDGLYSKPFITPENLDVKALLAKDKAYVKRCVSLNKRILPFVSTANVARDMDGIRAAMGDKKLNYFGFSYGTFLGATYASLFPDNYRAMVLDGPVDANSYINTPSADLREQSAGFERAIGRFFTACAVDQSFCNVRRHRSAGGLRRTRRPGQLSPSRCPTAGRRSTATTSSPRPRSMYAKQSGPSSRGRCPRRERRDGAGVRDLADSFFANNEDGTFDPGADRYFTITAIEQKRHKVQTFLDAGDNAWGVFNYTYWNTGYPELNYAIWPIHAKDSFYGPFKASKSAPTVLEIATTYDPATPYRGAKRLATQLGNVRFLTMVGDGHTAYLNGSPDLHRHRGRRADRDADPAAAGTTCHQDLPFVQPPAHLRLGPRRRGALGPAARAADAALPPSGSASRTRWVRVTRHPARTHPPTGARPGRPARAGAGGARVARTGVAPGRLVPGRGDLRVEGQAAQPDAVGGDQPESPGLDHGEVAVPAVAGEIEIAAAEAERVRAARPEDDALIGGPVVGLLFPPGRRAVEAAVGRGAGAAQGAVRRKGDQQPLPVVVW